MSGMMGQQGGQGGPGGQGQVHGQMDSLQGMRRSSRRGSTLSAFNGSVGMQMVLATFNTGPASACPPPAHLAVANRASRLSRAHLGTLRRNNMPTNPSTSGDSTRANRHKPASKRSAITHWRACVGNQLQRLGAVRTVLAVMGDCGHPTPYTLHPHPVPYPKLYTLHARPTTCSLHSISYTLHPTPYTLNTLKTLPKHATPYALHPTPYS
jgi:hypothetical protein